MKLFTIKPAEFGAYPALSRCRVYGCNREAMSEVSLTNGVEDLMVSKADGMDMRLCFTHLFELKQQMLDAFGLVQKGEV